MTVNTTRFTNWQDGRQPGAPWNRSSPNLIALGDYLARRWGLIDLGCYGIRPVRNGESWSSHAFGAANDRRYANPGPGRAAMLDEILPFLIDNSAEFGIQAIHDYVGCRIWRSNRGDGKGAYWKPQSPDGGGMGQSWAAWIHIETTAESWGDSRPIESRLAGIVVPRPSLRPGDKGPVVAALFDWLRFFGFSKAKKGRTEYTLVVTRAVKRLQRQAGLPADGRYGPQTAAAFQRYVDGLA